MNSFENGKKPTAIIIGAGPAGLTAAYELLKTTNYMPVILEESSEIGGISRTIKYKGNRMDIGGHRFFSKDEKIMKWWLEMMPLQGNPSVDDAALGKKKEYSPGGPDPEQKDRVMLVRERVSRIYYLRKFFDYPISIKPQTFINMGFDKTIKAGLGYISSIFNPKEEDTLEDFMINRFGKPLYNMFFENYTEKLWGKHPSQISASWGAQRIKGLNISKVLANAVTKPIRKISGGAKSEETSLIEQFYYPKYGPGQLWETVAQEIVKRGGEIHLNTKAEEIIMQKNRITAIKASKDGDTSAIIDGDVFLSSMPISDLVRGMKGVEIPQNVHEIAKGLPYRDFMTVGILVDRLKIKNETKIKTMGNLVPDCWIYVQEPDVKLGRLQIFNNWSPYLVEKYEDQVWLGLEYFCSEGDELWSMQDQNFITMATDELDKIGVISKDEVKDALVVRVKKAYPAYFGTYEEFDKVRDYLDGIQNLFCIGRNGQHRYNNMDHSMLTAMEAVKCLKNNQYDKSSVWEVNSEKEYHESK